jgi:hypothetical protein
MAVCMNATAAIARAARVRFLTCLSIPVTICQEAGVSVRGAELCMHCRQQMKAAAQRARIRNEIRRGDNIAQTCGMLQTQLTKRAIMLSGRSRSASNTLRLMLAVLVTQRRMTSPLRTSAPERLR